jgi:hypothetical protein
MNRKRFVVAVFALVLVAGVALAFAGPEKGGGKTVEGTLVDTKCYFADAANKGNDHGPMKGCGTMCAKGGAPVGVLTAAGKHYALVVPAPAVADHVGKTIKVTGEVREGSLIPAKGEIQVQEGGAWKTVKTGAMM